VIFWGQQVESDSVDLPPFDILSARHVAWLVRLSSE